MTDAVARFPWRAEADIYASPMLASLPPGLRGPRIYEVEELGDERVRIWMEDVPAAERPWDAARYATAARSLGRMAARSLGAQIPAGSPRLLPGYQFIYAGRTVVSDLPMVRSEELWRHPGLAAALGADPDLRHDLLALADRAAAILGALDRLPRSLAHGDACPQNLLADPGSDGCFVAVDWGFAGPAPIGYDLGQLLVGRAESGELPADDLRATFDVILSAYLDGLRDAQVTLSEEQVRRGFVGGMLLRSAFTALPFEWLRGALDDATASAIAHRARYARYLLDLGRSF